MRIILTSAVITLLVVASSRPAAADTPAMAPALAGVTFATTPAPNAAMPVLTARKSTFALTDDQTQRRAVAVEYSDAYRRRAKIHKYASFATLPLFAAEGFVGQSLYNNPSGAKKSAHLAIASGIGALFAINAVTGIWNLVDSRKDSNGRTRRTLHAVLMLAASGGFFATAATGPGDDFGEGDGRSGGVRNPAAANAHRAIAFTSIGLAATSYLIMLFSR